MPKQTKKWVQATATAVRNNIHYRGVLDQESLYNALNQAGFFWDSRKGVWEKTQQRHKPNSLFEALDGQASGILNIRMMTHPSEAEAMKEIVVEALDTYGMKLIEASNGYPNRRGVGVRVYLKFLKPSASEE